MNCKKCGNVLNPTDVICPSCGEAVNPPAPMTSSVQEVANNAPVATPMASTDVAVNPNVMVQQSDASAGATTVSQVQEVANNAPVATPMASTDVAVNPSVIMQPANTAETEAPNAAVNAAPVAEEPAPVEASPVVQAAPVAQPAPTTETPAVTPEVAAQPVNPTPTVAPAAPEAQVAPVVNADANQMQTPVAPVETTPQAGNAATSDGKKKLDIKFIIIVSVLVILIVGLGIFVGTKLFGGDSKANTNTTNTAAENNNKEDNGNENTTGEIENTTTSPVAVSDEFTSYGYTFTVPSELKFTQDSDLLAFSDGDNFLVNFTVLPASYNDLKSDRAVKDLVKELDVKEIDHTETRLNGVKYTLVSYEVDDSFGIIFYSGLDDYHMAFGFAFGKDSKSYDAAFEYISMIIKSAKTTSTFAPDDDKDKDYNISKDMLDSGKVKSVEYKL